MNGLIEHSVSASSITEGARSGGVGGKKRGVEELGIEQVIDGFTKSWNQHDAESFSLLFEENGDFVDIAGHRAAGRAGIESDLLALQADVASTGVLTNPQVEVRLLAADVAVAATRWRLESWAAMEIRLGSGIYILVKHGQQWLIRNARMSGISGSYDPTLAAA